MDTSLQPARGQDGRYRDRAWWALALIFAVALAAAFVWNSGAERRTIARMDPAERRLVYENAFGELSLAQVAFVLQFPECEARCQEIARSHSPRPTK
jgi:hypothetical protein